MAYLVFWYSSLETKSTRDIMWKLENRTQHEIEKGWVLPPGTFDYIFGVHGYDPRFFISLRFLESTMTFKEQDCVRILLVDEAELKVLKAKAWDQLAFVSDYEISAVRLRDWMTEVFFLTEAERLHDQMRFIYPRLKKGWGIEHVADVDGKLFDIMLNFEDEVTKLYRKIDSDTLLQMASERHDQEQRIA